MKEPTIYCRPFLDFSSVLCASDLDFYTDASGTIGFGGVREGKDYFYGSWPQPFLQECQPSIEYQELYAVTVGVLLWIRDYSNKQVCIFVDNESVEGMLNKMTTNCSHCMKLVRVVVLECMTWNVRLFAKHVSSRDNYFSDALSRHQMRHFWSLAEKHGKKFTTEYKVPDTLWPIHKVW